ncbi:hypothetical protein Y11_01671 [Yersinia enterocolitica subsp. palearctica Y11]|uniref:Uncharacterized protein n=1 Tax=Yersinia enterocolitica subsp. palearctica serotype O:3 (strain DSM 13030 / CIP 106945 / Y11) TaxID=930944 RepID=A0A0H3P071_YERE1|nr:hypothetical protein Y11_01671 [Yersinia enterocolitica subsp. palearctica Y11]CCO67521.1 hypothetical protein D322_625 [Yersinia enterocolitica IP 10393]
MWWIYGDPRVAGIIPVNVRDPYRQIMFLAKWLCNEMSL